MLHLPGFNKIASFISGTLLLTSLVSPVSFGAEHVGALRRREAPSCARVRRHESVCRTYPCEKYFEFISPKDSAAKDFKAEDPDMISWTDHYKSEFDKAFAIVLKKAPGLVARASNGERIPVLISRDQRAAMETNAVRIMVFTWAFKDGSHEVAETLAHEMTHLIDIGSGISWTKEWNSLITKRMGEYRRKFPDPDAFENERWARLAERERKRLGLPTDYTAQNQTEAMAEYAGVIAISDFKAPPEIDKFIREKILSMPAQPDPMITLIRQGYREEARGEYNKAIASFTNALRIDGTTPVAHWYLGNVWGDKNEPELVVHELKTAAALLEKNGVPSYSDDLAELSDQLHWMEMKNGVR